MYGTLSTKIVGPHMNKNLYIITWEHFKKISIKNKHIFTTELSIYMEINIHLRAVHLTKQLN